ncbi:MAG: hypothetical protein WBF89_22315 [Steroidobacteraceae bacterium]|jgi:hypothetical protein
MSSIRLWHNYIGIFIAPSVIFFALTGSLQIFNLHESHGSYVPPALIEKLSSMHKDQVFAQKPPKEPAPDATSGNGQEHPAPPAEKEEAPALGTALLKWFFLFVALALTASTLLGLWIGLTHLQRKRTGWWLLSAGIVVPIALFII